MRLWGRTPEPDAGAPIDSEAVRAASRAEIERLGGRTIAWLPLTEIGPTRDADALAGRILVLNALSNLAREAPVEAIRDYVAGDGLRPALTPRERDQLAKRTEDLTPQELINASWYDEAIYALAWAGGLMPSLPPDAGYARELLDVLPNVEHGESGRELRSRVRLRPYAELYAMRDLYYRAHWFTRNCELTGADAGAFHGGVVMERRKALEWLLDPATDWDDVELHT